MKLAVDPISHVTQISDYLLCKTTYSEKYIVHGME